MATWIHKTTLQVMPSVGSSELSGDLSDWIKNPDLSTVAGVPEKFWKLTGNTLSEMTQAEKDLAYFDINKSSRYLQIDGKTDALIIQGFTYDSKVFSLSLSAQMNFNALKNESSEFTWPVEITTISNDTYSLTLANLNAFWRTGKVALKGDLDTGRALKKQIFDATTQAAVDAIVDTR